ncbi:copper resistance CopC family protein [Methylocapsa acidiphila]|uniref:copper resistance CopC family protein n=1 Tax=Methylocapsa acidiphila TaxID=133552 RepID=UPI00041A1845|nr:copper resistance CopC family protein [Methylocapsa acidiphila]
MKLSFRRGRGNSQDPRLFRRHFLLGLAALGLGLGVSTATLAHSRLVRSEPPARAVLDAAPKELKFWFNEAIEPSFAKLWLVPASGDKVPLANHGDPSDPRLLIGVLPDNLPDGPVVIAYHVLSVDGHVVESQLNFSVNSGKPATH